MLQRKQRKNFVDLLKCSRAQFTNKALRFLLFANSSQRADLFYEVTHNGLLKQKFSNQLYGSDLTLLGNQVLAYNAKMSSDDAIDYACFLVDLYGQQINKYILLREQYEQRLYADSEDVAWKMDADDTLLLNGKYFVSFVDILCILLNNSLTHSGFSQKSISDLANAEKNDSAQPYAAYTSAKFAENLIRNIFE